MIGNDIIQGDCLAVLKSLPSNLIHTCVTSPPYWGLRDYGVEGQLGLEETPEVYVQKLVEVFREVHRVLRKDGTLWLNLGDSYAGSGKGACDNTGIIIALSKHGIKDLPTGVVLATANLIECHRVRLDYGIDREMAVTESGVLITDDEYWFGDYTTGRYAWELANVRQIDPIPAKGQQRLWNWKESGY